MQCGTLQREEQVPFLLTKRGLHCEQVELANKALECAPAGRSHGVAVLDDGLLALFGPDIPTVTLSTRITVNGALLA